MIAFPGSGADSAGNVNYRSTETLYFNEYWYEYETVKAGNTITFSAQSYPDPITFAIIDRPFSEMPLTSKQITVSESVSLVQNEYIYYQIFLNGGSSISYTYNASAPIEFVVVDGDNALAWENGDYFDPYDYAASDDAYNGNLNVYYAQDYYLIWYNPGSSNVDVDVSVVSTANQVVDLSDALYAVENTDFIAENSVTVPSDGEWYFIIYVDPLYALGEATEITFDVTFSTGVTASEKWANARPTLIVIGVICILIIGIAVVARRNQKKAENKTAQPATPSTNIQPQPSNLPAKIPPPTTPKKQQVQISKSSVKSQPPEISTSYLQNLPDKCISCGNKLETHMQFCPNCGKQRVGRQFGETPEAAKPVSKHCYYCGNLVNLQHKFCEKCGSPILN